MSTLTKQDTANIAPYVEEPVKLLDPYAAGGIKTHDSSQGLRMWAATISAGFKENNTPRVVTDGKFRLHEDMGDAPGIRAALDDSGWKSLTITMLSDSIGDCLKQLFTAYGSTKIFGDEKSLTLITRDGQGQKRQTVLAGTPEYEAALKQCKASTFVPFALAKWDEEGNPSMSFPDGLAP